MASVVIRAAPTFVAGTALIVWPVEQLVEDRAVGTSLPGATVNSAGLVSLTGLVADTKYATGPGESGPFIRFRTAPAPTTLESVDDRVAVIEEAAANVKNPPGDLAAVVGDGSANDGAALAAIYAAVPDGGTMLIPNDCNCKTTSQLVFDRRVNIRGEGIGSAITVAVGAGTDGIVFGTTFLSYGVLLRDFAVLGGASAARYAAVFRNFAHSEISNVFVKAGASWAASVEGGICNTYRLICPGNNMAFPYAATVPTANIRVVGSAQYPVNACTFDCISEAVAESGFVMDATVGVNSDFNNTISGTYEGCDGYGIQIVSCTNWLLRDAHLEGAGSANVNGLRIEDCNRGRIGDRVFCANSTALGHTVELVDTVNTKIDGLTCDALLIDAGCEHTVLGRMAYGSGGGAFTDNGVGTVITEGVIPISASTGRDFRKFAPEVAATIPNNSLFRDTADGKLKFKDNGGVVNALY